MRQPKRHRSHQGSQPAPARAAARTVAAGPPPAARARRASQTCAAPISRVAAPAWTLYCSRCRSRLRASRSGRTSTVRNDRSRARLARSHWAPCSSSAGSRTPHLLPDLAFPSYPRQPALSSRPAEAAPSAGSVKAGALSRQRIVAGGEPAATFVRLHQWSHGEAEGGAGRCRGARYRGGRACA